MQYTPHELKDKLLKALDEDNNVVDMAGVLAVITILETYPITRDVLEQTRIGRYVNELRKKTNNEQLAKRAKKLVRSWQKLLTPQTDSATVNGDRETGERIIRNHPSVTALQGNGSKPSSPALSQTSLSPAVSSPVNSTARSSLSKQQMGYKPNTPTLPHINQSVKPKPNTPKLPQMRGKPNTPDFPHYSKQGNSPNISNIDPKDHSTPKSTKTSRVANSIHKSKIISPECLSEASLPASEKSTNTSRPHTPVTGVSSSIDPVGKLHRNLSQDSLSNLSVTSGVSSEYKIPQNLNHSTSENGRTSSPCNVIHSDQSLNSKTNIASRKRSRNENQNAIPHKRSHANNGEAGSYRNVVNGAMTSASPVPTSEKSMQNISKVSPETPDAKQSLTSRRNVSLAVSMEAQKLSEKSLKTPKVKTTAQLIAELQAKSGSSAIGSSVIRQIECNQIQKESDEPQSVLPPGARPKRRQKNSEIPVDSNTPGKSHGSLSQTKTELVEKFLQSSVTPSSAVDMSPFKYDISSKAESPLTVQTKDSSIEVDVTDSSGDISFRPAEVKTEEQIDPGDSECSKSGVKESKSDGIDGKTKSLTLEEIYSQLPPIDYSVVTVDEDEPSEMVLSEPLSDSISDSFVNRLHNEEWEAVNGCFDVSGAWRDWTQTFTATSYESDPMYVLPYVLIDD